MFMMNTEKKLIEIYDMKKKLIIVDGPNGVGKTTIIQKLTNCDKVYAPGFTQLGKVLRPLCRGTNDIKIENKKALIHLFISDRLETLHEIMTKSPEKVVVTDRWLISTIAYQAIDYDVNIHKDLLKIIMSSVNETEQKMIAKNMFYIECDHIKKVDRIESERKKNIDHGMDNFTTLYVADQYPLSDSFKLAFNYFAKKCNKNVVKLINNTEEDLNQCVSTIQNEINRILNS